MEIAKNQVRLRQLNAKWKVAGNINDVCTCVGCRLVAQTPNSEAERSFLESNSILPLHITLPTTCRNQTVQQCEKEGGEKEEREGGEEKK